MPIDCSTSYDVDVSSRKEVGTVKMVRLNIQIPMLLKSKLDALRAQGMTASGLIRNLLERELNPTRRKRK